MKLKYMAVFGHLCGVLVAFVIIKGSASDIFSFLIKFLGDFISGSSSEAGGVSTLFTLPASLFLLLLFLIFVILACQIPALIITKLVMDRDQ